MERGSWNTAIDPSLLRLTPTPTHAPFRRRCSDHWNQIRRMKTRRLVPTLSSPPPSSFFLPFLFSSHFLQIDSSSLLPLQFIPPAITLPMSSRITMIPHSPYSPFFFSSAHILKVQKFCFSGLAQPIVLLRIQRVQTWCTEIPEIL